MTPSTTTDASALRTLLHSWEEGLRSLSMDLPSNLVRQQTIDALREGLSEVWQQLPDLGLTVTEAGLQWESETVLPIEDESQSLGWALFQEGIRWITFSPGVEREEIVIFLGLVQMARTLKEEDADDLLTLLWSADFEFIRYKVAQMEQGGGEPMEDIMAADLPPGPTADELQVSLSLWEDPGDEDGDGESAAPKAVLNLAELESTVYFLAQQEIDYLKEAVRREYEQNLNENVLSMLFDIFETQPAEDVRTEIITILGDFLPNLLSSGDFHSVAYLFSETHVLFSRADMIQEHRRLLAGLTMTLSNPEAVGQLLEALEVAAIEPSTEEIEELFAHLGPAVLSTLLKWHGRFSNEEVEQALEKAVVQMAEEIPAAVCVALESSERVVVIGALRLVAERGLVGVEDQLGGLIRHDDVHIRNALVPALVAAPTALTMKALVRLMEDTHPEVRTAAVRALALRRFQGALPVLEQTILGEELRSRDLTERKAFFEAYGTIAGDSAVSNLEGILLRKDFGRSEDSDTRACAAIALGNTGGQSAWATLRRAAKDRDPVVRSAALTALQEDPQ